MQATTQTRRSPRGLRAPVREDRLPGDGRGMTMRYREFAERVWDEIRRNIFTVDSAGMNANFDEVEVTEFLARCFERATSWRPGDPLPARLGQKERLKP